MKKKVSKLLNSQTVVDTVGFQSIYIELNDILHMKELKLREVREFARCLTA